MKSANFKIAKLSLSVLSILLITNTNSHADAQAKNENQLLEHGTQIAKYVGGSAGTIALTNLTYFSSLMAKESWEEEIRHHDEIIKKHKANKLEMTLEEAKEYSRRRGGLNTAIPKESLVHSLKRKDFLTKTHNSTRLKGRILLPIAGVGAIVSLATAVSGSYELSTAIISSDRAPKTAPSRYQAGTKAQQETVEAAK